MSAITRLDSVVALKYNQSALAMNKDLDNGT